MPLFPTVGVESCPLCSSPGPLVESHILPSFVFEWFRKTSPTGHVRHGFAPNVRIQDTIKQALLCEPCEQRIGLWEKFTAERLFHPYHDGTGDVFKHGPWLAKFCASVCWRVLYVMRGLGLKQFSERQLLLVDKTLDVWADFMFDRRPHPGKNELHILPVGILESANYSGLPTNFNRYLARAIDMDVVCSNQVAFAYVKMCQLIVVGFIENPYPREWQGTRVAIKQGTIGHQKRYVLPQKFGVYLTDQARRMARLYSGISPKQLAKIEEAFRVNTERASESQATRALEADIRMFGQAAFDKSTESDPKS
jgi:hypothetical protein